MKHIIIFILSITAPQDQISPVLCLKISSKWNQHKQYFSYLLAFPLTATKDANMVLLFFPFFFFFFICGRNFTFGFYICLLDSFLWHTAQEMSLPCVSGCLSSTRCSCILPQKAWLVIKNALLKTIIKLHPLIASSPTMCSERECFFLFPSSLKKNTPKTNKQKTTISKFSWKSSFTAICYGQLTSSESD